MNSSKLSAATTVPGKASAAAESPAFLSPAGMATSDAIAVAASSGFQALIAELLPADLERDLASADAGIPAAAADADDTCGPTASPDVATAQLMLQLPPLDAPLPPSSAAAPQPTTDPGACVAVDQAGTTSLAPAAGVIDDLRSVTTDADQPIVADAGTRQVHAAPDRGGRDHAGAWFAQDVLLVVPLKSPESADRPANAQGHQREAGSHAPGAPGQPPLGAAVAAAAASARELPTLPRLEHPVGTAAWRQELANTVNLMIDRGEQSATLRLSPEHLGPLEVRIAIREGETSLWFGAAHADTRQALEQALPRLREQFASAGLSLGQSSVSQGPPQEPRSLRAAMLAGTSAADGDGADSPASAVAAARRITGLVDTYV